MMPLGSASYLFFLLEFFLDAIAPLHDSGSYTGGVEKAVAG